MSSAGGRALVAVAAIAAAVVLFVVLRGGDDSDTSPPDPAATSTEEPGGGGDPRGEPKPGKQEPDEPQRPDVPVIEIEGGQAVGGVQELEFTKGERVQFIVRSDVADHVHLHGYDVSMDVAAGGEVKFDVPATIEGVFEAELEDRVVPIAEITVNPA